MPLPAVISACRCALELLELSGMQLFDELDADAASLTASPASPSPDKAAAEGGESGGLTPAQHETRKKLESEAARKLARLKGYATRRLGLHDAQPT